MILMIKWSNFFAISAPLFLPKTKIAVDSASAVRPLSAITETEKISELTGYRLQDLKCARSVCRFLRKTAHCPSS